MRSVTTLAIALAVSMIALILITGFASDPTPEPLSPRFSEGQIIEAASRREKPSRTAIEAEIITRILVSTSDGSPLEGATAYPWPTQLPPSPPIRRQSLGESDQEGVAILDLANTQPPPEIAIWRDGYVPALIEQIAPGATYRVTLEEEAQSSIKVETSDGRPIPDFAVAVTRVEATRQNNETLPRSRIDLRTAGRGGGTFLGTTSAEGIVQIRHMPAGRYLLQTNITNLPVSILNAEDNVVIDLPNTRRRIICEELVGAVLAFEEDEVLLTTFGVADENPFHRQMDISVNRSLEEARRQIAEKWPGSTVLAGAPRDLTQHHATLYVYGRTGGWSTHQVPLEPIISIDEPHRIVLPRGTQDKSALVTPRISVRNGPEHRIFDDEHAVFRWQLDDKLCMLECRIGREVRVPAGAFELFPGSNLGVRSFAPVQGKLTAGSVENIDIEVDHPWRRFEVEIRLPNGRSPIEFGMSLKGYGAEGLGFNSKFLNVSGATYGFWTPRTSHETTIFVKGYERISTTLTAGEGEKNSNHGETFVINVTEVAQ